MAQEVKADRLKESGSSVKTFVLALGFLTVTYGLFGVLESGSMLTGIFWILVGICLQIAGGAGSNRIATGRLENPLVVLDKGLQNIRRTVGSWDERPSSTQRAVEQHDAGDGAGKLERRR